MAEEKLSYATDEGITASNWEGLAADGWASLPLVDNTSNLYLDALVGGQINLDTATGSLTAGESFDIYISALYDADTTTTGGGGIDALLAPGDASLTEDTDFNPLNLIPVDSVKVEATSPDVEQGYSWGPISVASLFGGIYPQKWFLVGHNNTGGTTKAATSTTAVNLVGITRTVW